jgi:hypothetical protein
LFVAALSCRIQPEQRSNEMHLSMTFPRLGLIFGSILSGKPKDGL